MDMSYAPCLGLCFSSGVTFLEGPGMDMIYSPCLGIYFQVLVILLNLEGFTDMFAAI